MADRRSTYTTSVFRMLRNEYSARRFEEKIWIRALVDYQWNPSTHQDEIIWREEEAQLFYFRDAIFELPDDSAGAYVILEYEATNAYGYSLGHLRSRRELVPAARLPGELAHAGNQIINQLARVEVANDVVYITEDERNLNRKEG